MEHGLRNLVGRLGLGAGLLLLVAWSAEGEERSAPPAAEETVQGARLHGVDVSQFQGEIDWQAVRESGVVFAFARALEGETLVDSRFAANWQGMKEAGVVRGAYAFYVADDPPAAQAAAFTRLVTLEPGDLAPMVDIEHASLLRGSPPAGLVADLHTYLELLEAHYGVKPILYTDPDFWNEHMDGSFGAYPLWVADYDADGPALPDGWDRWTLWQHTDGGSVPGIDGEVDLDLFNGSVRELTRYRLVDPGSGR